MENTKTHMSPKDFFLLGGIVVALYTVAISFINLVFALIDVLYPPLNAYYGSYSSPISWTVAMLLVVFPTLLILSWLLKRDFSVNPEKKELGLRKWFVYGTLFITGIVLVVDLITVLYRFLNGDLLTTGFLLKALTVSIVAGCVFIYYVLELRGKTSGTVNIVAFWGSTLVVLALIIASFAVVGSPRTQRLVKYDTQRVQDLQNIQWQVLNFWQQKGKLPSTLSDLEDPFSGGSYAVDPETGTSYEYSVKNLLTFELCADFSLANNEVNSGYQAKELSRDPYPIDGGDSWKHNSGNQCFERTIDPERYPIFKK